VASYRASRRLSDPAIRRLLLHLVDQAEVMDLASVLSRTTRRGGWSVFGVHALGVDLRSPPTNSVIGFNCTGLPMGGSHCVEALTSLFAEFAAAPTLQARQAIAWLRWAASRKG